MYEYGREWMWSLSHGQMSLVAMLVGLGILVLHFLPSIIAFARGHHNFIAIFATNLLLGWTGIGWIVAFIWCLTAVRAPTPPPR